MKKLMPLIAASAILLGSACNTYTSTTDPADYGSGWGVDTEEQATGHTSSPAVAEANNNATFDNQAVTAGKDSATVVTPEGISAGTKAEDAAATGKPATTGQ